MGGLFGGRKSSYVAPATTTTQVDTTAKETEKKNKEARERSRQYGSDMYKGLQRMADYAGLDQTGDTTLASGSLLNLGSTLGG